MNTNIYASLAILLMISWPFCAGSEFEIKTGERHIAIEIPDRMINVYGKLSEVTTSIDAMSPSLDSVTYAEIVDKSQVVPLVEKGPVAGFGDIYYSIGGTRSYANLNIDNTVWGELRNGLLKGLKDSQLDMFKGVTHENITAELSKETGIKNLKLEIGKQVTVEVYEINKNIITKITLQSFQVREAASGLTLIVAGAMNIVHVRNTVLYFNTYKILEDPKDINIVKEENDHWMKMQGLD